ncbi:MAG: CCA tRNA nucleotidyltransferase [Aestuariivirga sp.]
MTGSTPKLPRLDDATWLREPRLQQVMAAILNAGEDVRVAGGAVRNALLGTPINDVDLATTMVPQDVMRVCKAAGFGVHPTGIDHGTVTVVNGSRTFEVTTLRRDVETDGRRAVVSFTRDFAEDAERRDFTMNALYCSARGEIFDFTNGYVDILKRRVKFVGEAETRIKEDYLRILRLFRFHAAYGEGTCDAKGLAAATKLRAGLKKISAERIAQEMKKLVVAPRAVAVLQVMAKVQILKLVFPHTDEFRVVGRLPTDPLLRLFVLAKRPLELKERLRLSNAEADRIEALKVAPAVSPTLSEQRARAQIYKIGIQASDDVTWISQARSKAKMDDPRWQRLRDLAAAWPVPSLPVSGQDLIAAGVKPGPSLGQQLRRIEDYWVAQDFRPGRTELLQMIERD